MDSLSAPQLGGPQAAQADDLLALATLEFRRLPEERRIELVHGLVREVYEAYECRQICGERARRIADSGLAMQVLAPQMRQWIKSRAEAAEKARRAELGIPVRKAPADRNLISGERLPFASVRRQLRSQRRPARRCGARARSSRPAPARSRGSRRGAARSHGRGGDSGDDSGGEPEPGPGRLGELHLEGALTRARISARPSPSRLAVRVSVQRRASATCQFRRGAST